MHFAFGQAQPLARCEEKLTRLVAWANHNSGVDIGLQGYLDERERVAGNDALSQARARAVRDALVARGVEAGRIRLGNGDGNWPLCAEKAESCWEKNRRVEVWAAAEAPR